MYQLCFGGVYYSLYYALLFIIINFYEIFFVTLYLMYLFKFKASWEGV
jgi:hypothetical protein